MLIGVPNIVTWSVPTCSGVNALNRLYSFLKELGHTVRTIDWKRPGNYVDCDLIFWTENCPLLEPSAKVIRWCLKKPGFENGPTEYRSDEFVVFRDLDCVPDNMQTAPRLFMVGLIDPNMFHDKDPKDDVPLFWFKRAKTAYDKHACTLPAGAQRIDLSWSKTAYALRLRRAKTVYAFEKTTVIHDALQCGAAVYLLSNAGVWEKYEEASEEHKRYIISAEKEKEEIAKLLEDATKHFDTVRQPLIIPTEDIKTPPSVVADAKNNGLVSTPTEVFDRIVCISLPQRIDRRRYLAKELHIAKWPFGHIDIAYGIDTSNRPKQPGFPSKGAHGCLLSHIAVLEKAIEDKIQTLMVLEDDCCFCPGFREHVLNFLSEVPSDWECLMIGGQLYGRHAKRTYVSPNVDMVNSVCRTHCYVLRGQAIESMLAVWKAWKGHCDHAFSIWHGKHKTYAPSNFLAGQMGGVSNNNTAYLHTLFWNKGNLYNRNIREHQAALDAYVMPAAQEVV